MVTGHTYRLVKPAIAIDVTDNKNVAIHIPVGSTIEVLNPTGTEGFVRVCCSRKEYLMFIYDILDRGERTSDHVIAS